MKPEKWWPIGLRNPAYRNGASRALADLEDILAYSWDRFPSTTAQFGNAILDHLEILGLPVGPPGGGTTRRSRADAFADFDFLSRARR
jgi:plasmid stabilization system protein ParE